MPANHPNPRPAGGLLANPPGPRAPLAAIAVVLLLVAALIPAVSAENIVLHLDDLPYTDTVEKDVLFEYKNSFAKADGGALSTISSPLCIYAPAVQKWPSVTYVSASMAGSVGAETSGEIVYYKRPSDNSIHTAALYVQKSKNALGVVTSTTVTIFPHDWEVGTASGAKIINFYTNSDATTQKTMSVKVEYLVKIPVTTSTDFIGPAVTIYRDSVYYPKPLTTSTITYVAVGYALYTHTLSAYLMDSNHLDLAVNRYGISSTIAGYGDGINVFNKSGTTDLTEIIPPYSDNATIIINAPLAGLSYTYEILGSTEVSNPEPEETYLKIYVKSSQTGALISGALLNINASIDDEFYPVVNTTLPSGLYENEFQPTGGGLPNPDFYRVTVTADGYNAEMPYADITLDPGMSMTMVMGMEPTTGGPEDPEETYVEFYVRDINANPLASAVVKCGGYTLITNSAGFTQFDVPKNATYQYTVQKTGYTAIEGSVTVGANSRYPVNVVLGAGTVPTLTPGPTEPGATPTPDTRTNEQKGQEVIDLIADFALPIAILAILATLSGLLSMMMPRRR